MAWPAASARRRLAAVGFVRQRSEKQSTMDDQARAYNTPDFALKMPDVSRLGETMPVRVGEMAPEFEVSTLDGQTFRLQDLRGGRHVVLMTGSITSPMCAFHVPALNGLS